MNIESVLLPLSAAALLVFVAWPAGAVFVQSVVHNGSFSLRAYDGMLAGNHGLVFDSFMLSASVSLLTALISVAIGIRIAYGSKRGRSVIVGALALSTISPPFLCSMAYLMLFGRRGLVTWRLLGLEWNPYGFHGVLMMETVSLLGLTSLLVAASLERVDGTLENVSLDLGAGAVRTFARISLPLALPGVVAAAVVAFVRSLSDFGTPLFLGGRFQVLASRAYNTLIGIGDFQLACAMNVLLSAPVLLVLFLRPPAKRNAAMPGLSEGRPLKLPEWFMFVPRLLSWAFVVVQILVYGLIFLGSVTRTWGVDFSFTTRHLTGILGFRLDSIARSLLCSLAAALLCCLFSALLALLLSDAGPLSGRVLHVLAGAPYLMPGTFFGVGFLLAFTRLPFELPASFLIAASCAFRQLSPSLRAAEAGLAQMDPSLRDAVRDLGGDTLHVLKDMLIPFLSPFLRLGFLNAFSASMTTTGPIIFLVSPYARVASIELFESINEGDFGAASAMGSLLILVVSAVNWAAWRRGGRFS